MNQPTTPPGQQRVAGRAGGRSAVHDGPRVDRVRGVTHSGIHSTKEPFVYSRIMFCDLDNIQLEFVAIDI
jgi:hypothetical protein